MSINTFGSLFDEHWTGISGDVEIYCRNYMKSWVKRMKILSLNQSDVQEVIDCIQYIFGMAKWINSDRWPAFTRLLAIYDYELWECRSADLMLHKLKKLQKLVFDANY